MRKSKSQRRYSELLWYIINAYHHTANLCIIIDKEIEIKLTKQKMPARKHKKGRLLAGRGDLPLFPGKKGAAHTACLL